MYDRLWHAYGPQHWWPARTATEVVVGAILTQNTAWTNVERAIENLRIAKALNWKRLRQVSESQLAEWIRPSGTYRVKAARLKAFVNVLWEDFGGSLDAMLGNGSASTTRNTSRMAAGKAHLAGSGDRIEDVRSRLLAIPGIGRETADAILLYAGNRPSFVVDAYTRRTLRRHFLIGEKADYEATRRLFHEHVNPDVWVYNEYHALLVAVGKSHCRTKARCDGCPLAAMPHDEQQ